MNTANTVPCATNDDVTTAAREAFAASKLAGNDDGAAFDDVNEAIRALVGSRAGTLDQETLTWTFDAPAAEWIRAYHIGPDGRRRVEVSGLQNDDSEDYVIQTARNNARPDEREIEIEYRDGTSKRFAVAATIDGRIEAAAQSDDPIRALRDLADDIANEKPFNAADYDRVIDQIDTIRRDAEEAALVSAALDAEVQCARMYARDESPPCSEESPGNRGRANERAEKLAEERVRAYAKAHGVPERETTIRLARDAAEDAGSACAIRGCDRVASGHGGHPDLCGVHADAEHALGRESAS